MAEQLYQNDPRWQDQKIGLQNSLTIEQVGCLLTSLAMIVNHFGGSETPASLNERMKASGGFNGAWIKSAQVPAQFPQLGMTRQKRVVCDSTPAPMNMIDAGLDKGSLVAVRVDWTPDANIDSHWVVIHEKEGDDYLIWDPWRKEGAADTLLGRYGFGDKEPGDVILEAIWHGRGTLEADAAAPEPATDALENETKTAPEPTAVKAAPGTTADLFVQPTIALKLRRQPQTGAQIRVLASDEILTVLDADAQTRIGKQGEWLHVQDADGTQGYVAAWLVRETAAAPAQPKTPPATPQAAASAVTVAVTSSSLSFRTQPRVSDETLIRYLPTGTKLTLLNEQEQTKVGQQGEWLLVKATDGTRGYVAAWHVSMARNP